MQQEALWSHEVVLAADASSPAKTRAFVLRHLVDHRLLYLVNEVRLVASELATNAVVHGQFFTVILEGRQRSVLLTVRDGSRTTRGHSGAGLQDSDMTGLGLVVVNLLSQTWGEDDATGSVWARFEMRSPRAS
jgi:anti-sigma regulatory factor (Ser/Thr protein kinase)